jgi:NAD(P)-dependent dehydrogenase (short-subunit alcohol dehydrogenase family)
MSQLSADFLNRVVVISSAARGMGRAYADAFLERGARVVGLDRSWDDGLPGGMSLTCDVTSESTLATAFEQTIARFGTVDVLVNNAAMRQRDLYPPHGAAAVRGTYDEHWQRMFDVNVFGVLKVIRQFVQPMLDKRRGSIVNVSSGGSVGRAVEEGCGLAAARPFAISRTMRRRQP